MTESGVSWESDEIALERERDGMKAAKRAGADELPADERVPLLLPLAAVGSAVILVILDGKTLNHGVVRWQDVSG